MTETLFLSGRDTLLLCLPLLAILLVGFFRLDELFAASHRPRQRHCPVSGLDVNGEQILSDPDGTRWK
jgi:hypothetical protein